MPAHVPSPPECYSCRQARHGQRQTGAARVRGVEDAQQHPGVPDGWCRPARRATARAVSEDSGDRGDDPGGIALTQHLHPGLADLTAGVDGGVGVLRHGEHGQVGGGVTDREPNRGGSVRSGAEQPRERTQAVTLVDGGGYDEVSKEGQPSHANEPPVFCGASTTRRVLREPRRLPVCARRRAAAGVRGASRPRRPRSRRHATPLRPAAPGSCPM
jgi:hypothetical protein